MITQKDLIERTREKCKTIDDFIEDLEYWKTVLGGDSPIYFEDSSANLICNLDFYKLYGALVVY
jgi:hypothetical protein